MASSPRSGESYEPRRSRSGQWQSGEEIPVHNHCPIFDSSLGDDEHQMSPYERMWEDVQSLIRASNENFEARLIE